MARECTNDSGHIGAPGPQLTTIVDNLTIGYWFWTSADGGGGSNGSITMYNGDSSLNGYGLTLNQVAGQLRVLLGGVNWFGGGSFGALSRWHSGIATRSAGTWQVYLDGVALGATFTDTPNALSGGSQICGLQNTFCDAGVLVKAAEGFLYSRVLTGAEIIAIGTNKYSPLFIRQNLVEYYPLKGVNNPEQGLTAASLAPVNSFFTPTIDHPDILYPGAWLVGGRSFRANINGGAMLRPRPLAPGIAR